jgi:hypothetical protein
MAGAAAVGVAGGLAVGSFMHHEQEQSDRINQLEHDQRQLEQGKLIKQVVLFLYLDVSFGNRTKL